ncbi:MAG TPA: DUF2339 domain-containing protein, partial [Stellaceae bacterium]|nr:DUF2339 domain-containing protein [Stellaceae bacterium]
MDWNDVYPGFTIGLVAALVIALKAVVDVSRLRAQFVLLTEKIASLDNRVLRLAERLDEVAPPSEVASPIEPAAPAVTELPASPTEPPAAREETSAAPQEPTAVPEEAAASTPPPPPPTLPGRGWEQLLVEHWLVWVGGAAMALGGAFLVKLSIDQGLLTPLVRVILGVLLGIGLSVAAEWVRRRELLEDAAVDGVSYVPQALAAAGAATVFASLYAAHALYGFLPAGLAFPLLALTAGATVLQSLQYGPLVAALGLVGAFVVPLLVTSDAPQALPLFAYLAVVTAAALALLRFREWWWLAWPSLAGAILWEMLWLATPHAVETPVVAGYLLVQFGLFVAFRRGIPGVGFLAGTADTKMVRVVMRAAFWAIAFGLLRLAAADGFGDISVGAAVLTAIGLMAFAYRDSQLDDVIAVAGVLALALLASWDLTLPIPEMSLWVFKIETDHIADFSTAAILFTLILGGGGFAVLTRVARPGRWAALSASLPLLVLVIAYWRLQKFEIDIAWTLTALALAGLELAAAATVAQRRGEPPESAPEIEIALAAYAVGVLGSTILAATLALGEAWLTVALALHLPAIGWVEGRVRLPMLRRLALGVAAVVLVRLAFNPYVLSYPIGPTPIFNWLLYGYGIPAAAFIVATRQFGSSRDDLLVAVLEAGSAVFSLLLLSLELTHAIYGDLRTFPLEDFGAGAALFALWLTFAGVLLAVGQRRQRPVLRRGGWLLLAVTTAVELLWQPIMLLFGARVGNLAIVDALLLADAAPAVIYATIAWLIPTRPVLRTIARVLAAAYAFAWITLEIQHIFHGNVELFRSSTEAEWYTYSVAWLVFAGAGFAGGLVWRNRWLRQAGLIGIGIVVAKVFLSDMDQLSGVLRALSFLGLGATLVGFGYAYRR